VAGNFRARETRVIGSPKAVAALLKLLKDGAVNVDLTKTTIIPTDTPISGVAIQRAAERAIGRVMRQILENAAHTARRKLRKPKTRTRRKAKR
jgi:hypothetical protein